MTEDNMMHLKPYPLGVHVENGCLRFSFSSKERDCGILIYDRKTGKKLKKIAFGPEERVGNVYCKYLPDFSGEEIAYQFYENDRIVPDRYARMFMEKLPYGREHKAQMWKAVLPETDFDWERDKAPAVPYHESICYCAHVRGFTRHKSSGVACGGTFLGMTKKIGYLKKSGITTLELQPVYEFAEIPTDEERKALVAAQTASHMVSDSDLDMLFPKKCNYWGYKRGFYYAPKSAYAAGENVVNEFKEMVKAFHKEGLEIILQFYFPKSVKMLEIPEILKFWVLEYHVDGFHLMGENLPVEMIAADEMLADTKLWYDHFEPNAVYPVDEYPEKPNLAVCKDDYIYVMRKFLKGDEGMLGAVMSQMRHIPEKMGRIHYMSHYCGFTLMDMVSYDRKHNEANGEDNRDGNDYNCSWNCGEEGSSRRKKVIALRHRQVKNAMAMLLFSQSTPMIFMGDEFGNSQKGNNNPYCQDNTVTWLDWNDLEKNRDLYEFWRELVALRKAHPILHPCRALKVMDYISCGYPDLSYHGQNAWRPRTESYNRHIGIMYCGKYAKVNRDEDDAFLYVAMNMYWEGQTLALPKLPKGMKWEFLKSTAGEKEKAEKISAEGIISVPERSVTVYIGVWDQTDCRRGGRKA